MAYVQDLLNAKGARTHCIVPEATVYEATARMNQYRIGALVVVQRDQPERIVGIFTERDVLRRVVGQLRYPDTVQVGEVMTQDVISVSPETTVDEAASIMQERRVRHLPVLDDFDQLVGLVSIGDINAWHVHHQAVRIEQLNEYICGRG